MLTAGTYGNVVRLLPPLTIDETLLADGLDVLDDAIGHHPHRSRRRLVRPPVATVRAWTRTNPDPAVEAGSVRVCGGSRSTSRR